MPASATDYFQDVNLSTATTLAAPGYTVGNPSINVASTASLPSATGITFSIDEVDGNGARIPGTYNVFRGVVSSATQISSLTYVGGDANRNYSAGATTRVYQTISAFQNNRMVDGLEVSLNQDGTLKDNSVTTANITDANVTTAKLADASVTAVKLGTPIGFSARMSTNQSVAHNTNVKVEFDTELFDYGSNYDTTTYRFTAPYDGVYHVSLSLMYLDLATDVSSYAQIYKNGSQFVEGRENSSRAGEETVPAVDTTILLDAGDYIEFWARHTHGSARDVDAATYASHCNVTLVGRTD